MSKFNLSSVYTNDNIYSVLKLLKALIDTLDNYEFQDPIVDANGNQIPMTWFQKLYKSINGADDGSVTVSKDSHVTGSLNVDLSALINGTIRLAKNKLGLKQGADEKIYFSNVTLKYKDNTEYPGIVILYSYQYAALVIDVNNSVLHFLSSPLGAITETNTGFEITAQPFGNVKINCSDLMTLPSKVNDLESQFSNILPHVSATAIRSADNPNSFNISFNANNISEPFILDVTGAVTFSAIIVNNLGSAIYDFDGEQASLYWVNIDSNTSGYGYRISLEDWPALDEILTTYQSKLYRHTLNVKSASYFAVFDYYCASSEPINTTQALTTYLKPTATSVYPCACFTNNATPAPANMNAIKYSSNVWKFCLTGGTAETLGDSVLSVSDSVTAAD